MTEDEVKDIARSQVTQKSGYSLAFNRNKLHKLNKSKVIRACEAALKKLN